ncbi:MAG: outer membrane beta-barrel protein [Treponema sp.]|nr:outer membrane beta-barrel protein [Treponema sp.]
MKKIIAVGIVALMAMAFAAAQQTTGIALGVRGVFSYSAGSSVGDDFKDIWATAVKSEVGSQATSNVDTNGKLGGGFALFMRLPLGKRLGAQFELDYTYNTVEYEKTASLNGRSASVTQPASFHTLSVPILLTFNIVQTNQFFLTPFGGIQIAKPVGKFDLDGTKATIDTFALFSFVVGASATVNFGRFGLVGDIRYNIGVNSIKAGGLKVVTPRALQFSAGIQYML